MQIPVVDNSQASSQSEKVSLKPKVAVAPKEYKVDKVELSANIKKFDNKRRTRVITQDPYDYNTISLKKKDRLPVTPTAYQMIADPLYNTIGKFLGVDTLHDWGKDYDKVYEVVEWAKAKSGAKNVESLMQWLNGALNFIPSLSMNHRKIDQLRLYARLQGGK